MLALGIHAPNVEDDLVVRLRDRDRSALGEAYDRHHAQVRGFARRVIGDDAQAEDLVQEVFIALPGAIEAFEGRSKLSTFLLGMTFNLGRKHIRTAARKRAMVSRLKQVPTEQSVDGERLSQRAQLAKQLVLAMDTLPEDQRAAFTLMELEEYTSVEVAEIIGVPEGTVRTRVFHAKRKLRELLEGWSER